MITLRKIAAVVLGVGMISTMIPTVVMADNTESYVANVNEGDVTENVFYDEGYEITTENGNVVKVVCNGEILFTAEYDNAGNRITKNGVSNSIFLYENGLLSMENRNGRNINYLYEDKSNGAKECIAFVVDGEKYYLNRDEFGKIIGISDCYNNEIARYSYSDIDITGVFRYDKGEWIEEYSEEFIGNYNKIRLYGDYKDDETGWYYSSGLYTDASRKIVIGLNVDDVDYSNPFYESDSISLLSTYYEDIELAAEEWTEDLLNNSNFVRAKTKDDIGNMSLVEKIARTIYGENTSYTGDQNAIAWVILNRHHQWNQTLGQVVVPSQFYGLESSEGLGTITGSTGWKNAIFLACLMQTDSSEDAWTHIQPRPYGISNQLYFVSARRNIVERTGFVDEEKVDYKSEDDRYNTKYTDSYGNVSYIENIAIAGRGVYKNAHKLIEAYEAMNKPWINIFFNKK